MRNIALLVAFLLLSTPAFADVSVSVTNAWARPTINGLLVSAIYLDIKNNGKEPIALTSVTSSVGTASLHESMQHEGMMHMQPLESVKVAAGATASFSPGHKHIMLENLKSPLKQGDTIKLTLNFDAGSATVEVPVSGKAAGDKMMMDHPM